MELFYPTSNSGGTPLHHAAYMEEIQPESSNNPTSDSGVTPPYQAAAALLPYTVDHVKGLMVGQLRNISLQLRIPILNEETNQKLSKPILREKLIAFIQAQDHNINLEQNLNGNPDSSQNISDNFDFDFSKKKEQF